jgi:small subunit ribosomal protein S3
MARTEKFSSGYMVYSGEPAEYTVKKAYATAQVKLGTIGIQVRIVPETPSDLEIIKRIEEGEEVGDIKEETTQTNDAN